MQDDSSALEYTGERMVPEGANARTFWEHVGRYRFAKDYVRGRRVLDIACGEGYGASALAGAGASNVIGVDISEETCLHAQHKYALDARPGNAEAIPLPDRSIDLVVSFETIEHVPRPLQFLRECARVLNAGGRLIISTPNRPVYSDGGSHNPFHHTEVDEAEFLAQLSRHFVRIQLFTQFPKTAAWWSPRSLAAEKSPWLRIKGFWRLSTWFCPAKKTELTPEARASAVESILAPASFPGSLFDPYLVRPKSKRGSEAPYYLIAVADGVKPL